MAYIGRDFASGQVVGEQQYLESQADVEGGGPNLPFSQRRRLDIPTTRRIAVRSLLKELLCGSRLPFQLYAGIPGEDCRSPKQVRKWAPQLWPDDCDQGRVPHEPAPSQHKDASEGRSCVVCVRWVLVHEIEVSCLWKLILMRGFEVEINAELSRGGTVPKSTQKVSESESS